VTPVRVGIVGAGWIAGDHVAILRGLAEAEVVALCDLDREKAERLAPPGARLYESWEELLEREEPDALWVCTPPLAHRAPAVAALERGIPVFLEKPLARTLEDAEAIVEAWERTGTVCAVGYQWRATEALESLREAVDGQEVALLLAKSFGPTQARPWFLDRAQGGGNVLERASHQVDLVRAVAGEVVSVQAAAAGVLLAQGEGERGDIEDAAAITLRLAGGAVASVVIAWTREGHPGLYSLDVLASDATLSLVLDPEFRLEGVSRGRRVEAQSGTHPFQRQIVRFLEAARAREPGMVFCTPADALGTLAACAAAERALASGGAVSVASSGS
jgi:myo-inositol 2-dehydrogenase/D-chiro-inositol 1-dehydrogenase